MSEATTEKPTQDAVARNGRQHLLGLDGLRGLAALGVMTSHVQQHLSTDEVVDPAVKSVLSHLDQGLTLFFVLSGFLLYRGFAARLFCDAQPSGLSLSWFYAGRFLRIFPAYVFVLLIVSFGFGLTYVTPPSFYGSGELGPLAEPGILLWNLALLQQFNPSTMGTGLGVSWTLTVELSFYAVLPILIVVLARCCRRANPAVRLLMAPMFFAVVGAGCWLLGKLTLTGDDATRYELSWGGTWHAVFERSLLCQAHLFAAGMAAAALVELSRSLPERRRSTVRRALYVTAVAGTACAFVIPLSFAVALVSGAIVALIGLGDEIPGPLWRRCLKSQASVFLGTVSYSFYLWHLTVINLIATDVLEFPTESLVGLAGAWLFVLAVTLVLAVLTYRLVERPVLLVYARRRKLARAESASNRQELNAGRAPVQAPPE